MKQNTKRLNRSNCIVKTPLAKQKISSVYYIRRSANIAKKSTADKLKRYVLSNKP